MAVVLKKTPELECTCPGCGSLIGYTEDDMYMGYDGLGIDCPECGDFITTKGIAQDKWPEAFFEFGSDKNSVHLSDNEVQKYIDYCINDLIDHNQDYTYVSSGDTFVFACLDDDDIVVRVCQGYHEAFVDKDWAIRRGTRA